MEINIPISGARKMNKIISVIFFTSTILLIAIKPFVINAWQMAAPAKPPMSVCDEEEGMPYHQVSKFQKIAAINPESITGRVI